MDKTASDLKIMNSDTPTPRTAPRWMGAAALTSVLLLGGCTSVPDAINPVEWYKSTVDIFSDEEQAAEAGAPQGLPADTAGRKEAEAKAATFPKVSDVPEAAKATTAAEQQTIREGLIGDRDQRRYASAPIARQNEDGAGTVTTTAGVTQPPPPALPAVPVTPAPVSRYAAAPAPSTASSTAPLPPTTVAETFQNRLNQKYKAQPQPKTAFKPMTMPMDAPQPSALASLSKPSLPANARMPIVSDPLATVVISSDGVVSQGSQTSSSAQPYAVSSSSTASSASNASMVDTSPAVYGQGSLKIATILFENGEAKLSGADIKILSQVSAILKSRGGRLRVVGHASSRTRNMDLVRHKMVNFQLSATRADRVAHALVKIGVAPELISVVAQSDAEPIYYEVMPSGEAGNRRAEIYLDS